MRCDKLWPDLNKKKNMTTPKLGPQKNVSVIAFRFDLTIDVKILLFDCQVAVCVNKRNKSAISGSSWIQKLSFDCLLHRLLICSTKIANIFNLFKFVILNFCNYTFTHSVCPSVRQPSSYGSKKKY